MTPRQMLMLGAAVAVGAAVGAYATYGAGAWQQCTTGSDKCKMTIYASTVGGNCDGGETVNYSEIAPKYRSSDKHGVVFIWKFDPSTGNRYQFCKTATSEDGIAFTSDKVQYADDQFPKAERCRVNSEDNDCATTAPACSSTFRIKSKELRNIKYKYTLTFTDTQANKTCTIDPWVKNG